MNIKKLNTEGINQNTLHIDAMDTREILLTINKEDEKIACAVRKTIPEIAKVVDFAATHIIQGGRIIYIGAGTSGRLGVLDASECPPTYGVSHEMVQGIMAGGFSALLIAAEGVEDDANLGEKDLKDIGITINDTIIGIAASGRTPYVIGALNYANRIGAFTCAISSVENSEISGIADSKIEAITGPEVICGSTRMKAGTAQKLILNMISTTTMIKLGNVYGNLMVNVQPTNLKLEERSVGIIATCVGCNDIEARSLFDKSDKNVKLAICMGITGASINFCKEALINSNGKLSLAIKESNKL
ncbi:MAG: N-acetylmuramic acid 6-phosphate etherase [Longicatena sp.]